MRKRAIKALPRILLAAVFLLNTLTVMAAETDEAPPPAWLEIDTFEELNEALEASTPRETMRLRLTSNITVPAIEESCVSGPGHPVELDLGPHTLYVEGKLRLQSGVTLMGSAGEDALIRVRPGGKANIHNVTIQAGDRCAVWQEEGAIFTFTPMPDFTGEVHYAERAVAIPHSFISWQVAMPVAVVHDGQTLAEVLSDTDNVQWFYQGKVDDDAYIAVDWEIDPYRAELDKRTRTVITGSYPDAVALHQPICLVVFQNGNPAIFLDAHGMEAYGQPKAKVKIELIEPELGCRFEWSQDGKTWLPADAVETPSSDGRLAFTVSFPQETPPTYPYYLSAVVDYPDGSTGYSDVIIIEGANSECGSGGNRHGGVGITPPPAEQPPIGGDGPGQPVLPAEPEPPAQSTPPAEPEPPITEAPAPPVAAEPPAAVKPAAPRAKQAGEEAAASTAPAQPEPPPTSDCPPSPPATVGVKEAAAPVVTETKAPAREGTAPTARAVAQVAVGAAATGGIITLAMTWESWSKRLLGLLRKLLKL